MNNHWKVENIVKKENLFVFSNYFFHHNVFRSRLLQMRQKASICGKRFSQLLLKATMLPQFIKSNIKKMIQIRLHTIAGYLDLHLPEMPESWFALRSRLIYTWGDSLLHDRQHNPMAFVFLCSICHRNRHFK